MALKRVFEKPTRAAPPSPFGRVRVRAGGERITAILNV
jgi:hypothetical protein